MQEARRSANLTLDSCEKTVEKTGSDKQGPENTSKKLLNR